MEREEVKQFVDSELESYDYASDFSGLDSLAKLELIMKCEGEFMIAINENELENERNWTTDMFVDYLTKKVNER